MIECWQLMAAPFAACLVLTGIHAYLGLHVIERGVIFVDLALAQIAALGATVGFLFGFGLHHSANYLFALGCTFLGAVIFSATRFRQERVPHEAIIGVVYAVAAAASILVLSRAPEGGASGTPSCFERNGKKTPPRPGGGCFFFRAFGAVPSGCSSQ